MRDRGHPPLNDTARVRLFVQASPAIGFYVSVLTVDILEEQPTYVVIATLSTYYPVNVGVPHLFYVVGLFFV